MCRLRTHGITNVKTEMKKRPQDEIWNYQQIDLGFNYRMNDIQATIGLSQMNRLDKYVTRRHEIAEYYDDEFKNLPITIPWQSPKVFSSYHLYSIRIKNNQNNITQQQVYNELKQNNISVNLHYIPVHRHPYYENLGFKKNDFPVAEKFHQETISIPIFPLLTNIQQEHVAKTLKNIFIK